MAARSETTASSNRSWEAVWKLQVPPKVRVFWWRVLHNALPSKSELKRRHVSPESFCEVCGNEDESLHHLFFICPIARRLWLEIKKLSGVVVPCLHPASWTTDAINTEVCAPKVAAVLVCGAWALWTGRNARRHGRKVWEPGATARYITSLLEDLISLKMPSPVGKPARDTKWHPPEEGWVKLNTDAAFNINLFTGSAGVVMRDHQGQVLAAAARWFDDVPDALTAEALAAKEGLELAVENGYDRVILEVDCSSLKNLIEDDSHFRSSIGGFVFDIIELSRSFSAFRIVWVCREANSVAHACANMVSVTERSHFWLDYIPEWLKGLAAVDCTPGMI